MTYRYYEGIDKRGHLTFNKYAYFVGNKMESFVLTTMDDDVAVFVPVWYVRVTPAPLVLGRSSLLSQNDMNVICDGIRPYRLLDDHEFFAIFDEYCTDIEAQDNWK